MNNGFDVMILGGGASGLAAAVESARCGVCRETGIRMSSSAR